MKRPSVLPFVAIFGVAIVVGVVSAKEYQPAFVWNGNPPSGTCEADKVVIEVATGKVWCCATGTWTACGVVAGNAATATALAANPTDCTSGQYATTIAASGNLTCATVAVAEVTGAAPLSSPTFTGTAASPAFSSTAASGSNGFACTTNGCRVDYGTGASDYIASDGSNLSSPAQFSADQFSAAANGFRQQGGVATVLLNGVTADGASAVPFRLQSYNVISTAGGKVGEVKNGATGTVTFSFYPNGVAITAAALPTCGGTGVPEGMIVIVPGVTTTPTKMCVCTYTPTGTAYAWVDALSNNAGTGIGTTTTCP